MFGTTLFTAIGLAMLTNGTVIANRFDYRTMDMGGFVHSQTYPAAKNNGVTSQTVTYLHPETQAVLSVETIEMSTPEAQQRVMQDTLNTSQGELLRDGYSKAPLGEVSGHGDAAEKGSLLQCAFAGNYGVIVSIAYSAEKDGDDYKVRILDAQRDTRLVEGLARLTLGRMLAEPRRGPAAVTLHSRTNPAQAVREAGLVSLAAWAQTHQATLTTDILEQTATLQIGDKTIILALGAKSARVNDKWTPITDFVICRGADWYLPIGQIEALLNRE